MNQFLSRVRLLDELSSSKPSQDESAELVQEELGVHSNEELTSKKLPFRCFALRMVIFCRDG